MGGHGEAPAIVARDLRKVYRRFLHQNQFKTLKSALLRGSLLSDLTPEQTFTALDRVSFDVPRGCTYGVIGENGSGKSTLLKLTAGITKPTSGTLSVDGRISALIELGAGFHPEISGRENVAINGIMLGLTRREVEERFDSIVDFAELREFIDLPVKAYSSGMYMRLGFAVAIHVDPEVLLIDEVLAVGDEAFTRKCLDKIGEFRCRGKTILLVSHSLGLVEKMCDEVLWLRHGRTGRGRPQAGRGRLPHLCGRRWLMHLERACRFPDIDDLFVRTDVTGRARAEAARVPAWRTRFAEVLAGSLPEVRPSKRCEKPPRCPFWNRCWRGLPGTCSSLPAELM